MRAILTAITTGYTILITTCRRCGLRYDAGDEGEKSYHTQAGGCR